MNDKNRAAAPNRIRNVETVRVFLPAGLGDEIRILRRKLDSKKNPGLWEVPGGQREANETREQCVVRETQEETGLWIKIGKLILLDERHVDDVDMLGTYIAWGCEGRAIDGVFIRGNEHIDDALIDPLHLPQLDFTGVTTTIIGVHNRGKFDL